MTDGRMIRATLLALAEHVEAASGADRELDDIIARTIWPYLGAWLPSSSQSAPLARSGATHARPWVSKCYTSNFDAAMTLVPSEWDIEQLSVVAGIASCNLGNGRDCNHPAYRSGSSKRAPTIARALTAAALRARAAEMGDEQ